MRYLFCLILFLIVAEVSSQSDTGYYFQVHFLYGSKPKRKYKKTEPKYFGGLHGGHVTIQIDSSDYGFEPAGGVHIFARRKYFSSDFIKKTVHGKRRYDDGRKSVSFIIPITKEQSIVLKQQLESYDKVTPYDYAFFGMRCAACTRDILAKIGYFKRRNRCSMVVGTFYPKKLRKRMFKMAKKKNWQVIKTAGGKTRKWEKD